MSTASTSTTARDSLAGERATWLWGGAALVAVVVGALVTRAYAPTAFGDPGPFVLWVLPVAKVVASLSSAATIGLLVAAAFFVPGSPDADHRPLTAGSARAAAARTGEETRRLALTWASLTALVWTLAAALVVVTTFADLAGLRLTDPGYLPQLGSYVWSLDVTRVQAISALLAALVLTGTVSARSRATIVWLAAFALVGVLVLALTGHSAGSADHETAVNALGVHLLGVSVWTGGLFALVVLRRHLGATLGATVARYSVLATWCYAGIVVSGVQQAWIRIGALSGLLTAYGLVLLVKIAVTGVIGWLALLQRRNLAGRLTTDPGDSGAFGRLALGELALMGVAAGLATVLARSVPPVPDALPNPSIILSLTGYPDPGPYTAASWITAWRIDWFFLALSLVMMGLYAAGVVRLRSRGDTWPWGRTVSWMLGWVLMIYATCGAPDIWGRVLFSVHMLMHMLVAMIVPLLLVPGAPLTLALRALHPRQDRTWGPRELITQIAHSRVLHWLANPVVAACLFFFSLAAFYWTPLFSIALTTHTGHMLMMGHFLLTGYLFVWVLIGIDPGPPRWSPLMLLVILFATISFHAFFGVALTDATELLAGDFFTTARAAWMPAPFADQHTAGEIAWGIGEVPTLVLAILVARNWVKKDEQDTIRLDRAAERDGEADLTAYNDFLAGLKNEPER